MGKTVTTYLIDGDPKGTRYVLIRTKETNPYNSSVSFAHGVAQVSKKIHE